MIESLKTRFIIIFAVLAVSLFLIYPSIGPVPAIWSKYLPDSPIRLGLDLQGGLYLVLEVQVEKAVEAAVDQTMLEVSGLMKDERIRYIDILRKNTDSFVIDFKDPGVRKVALLTAPVILGLAIAELNLVIATSMATSVSAN